MLKGANQSISLYFRKESKQDIVAESITEVNFETKNPVKQLQVQLERIDGNIKITSDLFKLEKQVHQPLRRSARNLQTKNKENDPKPVIKEIDINNLSAVKFRGQIKFYKDFYRCAEICDEILQNIQKSSAEIIPIGFDLEWPFSFQTGSGKTALAQICMTNDVCYLFHLYNLTKLPLSFIGLLNHPKIKLVGVNIKNDIWKLGRDFKEFPALEVVQNNCIDCGVYLNKILNQKGRWSLQKLTAYLLHKKIDKNPKVRHSKWHILPLNNAQKNYAATDAYVSWFLYIKIEKKAVEVAKEEEEKEKRRKQQLESGEITEPELFAIL